MIGTLSTEDCSDVAVKMLQYINSLPPALLDSSSSGGTNDTSSSLVAPPLQTSPQMASTTSKVLPLSHMTTSQFSDHMIQSRKMDHVIPKITSFPNPTTNNDKYVDVTDVTMVTTCM